MDVYRPGDGGSKDLLYQRIAAQYSAILGMHVTVLDPDDPRSSGYEGFRVKTVNGYHADVLSMLMGWRLTLVPEGAYVPVFADMRYWCFYGRDMLALALAVGQAATFDGSDSWCPIGFNSAWDEEG